MDNPYLPYVVGVAALIVLFIIIKIAGKVKIAQCYEGADGRPSTSKFQFFLWTVVIIFSFTALLTWKFQHHQFQQFPGDLPANVLIAMGISIASASTAKAITTSFINTQRITKDSIQSGTGHFGQIFQDDSGFPDLSKIQMITWTFIAAAAYLIVVCHDLMGQTITQLPDIDKSLMALMGLGSAAYLGKKAVDQTTPEESQAGDGNGDGTNSQTQNPPPAQKGAAAGAEGGAKPAGQDRATQATTAGG
jgi:hypothetical protein